MLRICTVRDKMKNILKNYFLFIKIYEKYFYQKSKKKNQASCGKTTKILLTDDFPLWRKRVKRNEGRSRFLLHYIISKMWYLDEMLG